MRDVRQRHQNSKITYEIFREKSGWYDDAKDMEKEWGTPIHVAMAIIKQESSFRHDAKPPKDYVLGFIPWGRVSSAAMHRLKIQLGMTSKIPPGKVVHAPVLMIR